MQPKPHRQKYALLFLLYIMLHFMPALIPAQAQTTYAWYGWSGQATNSVSTLRTWVNNGTRSRINQTGTVVEFSTNLQTASGGIRFKLATPTGNNKEFNIYWTSDMVYPSGGGRENFTGYSVACADGDYLGIYWTTGTGDLLSTFSQPGFDGTYYDNNNLAGIHVLDDYADLAIGAQVKVEYVSGGVAGDWTNSHMLVSFLILGFGSIFIPLGTIAFKRDSIDAQSTIFLILLMIVGMGLLMAVQYVDVTT